MNLEYLNPEGRPTKMGKMGNMKEMNKDLGNITFCGLRLLI